jgi:hypothetical protein
MKDIRIEDAEKNVQMSDLIKLEKRIGEKLPEDYKEFLFKFNGGHPIKSCFPLIEPICNIVDGEYNVTEGSIAWFFALYDGDSENLMKKYNEFCLELGVLNSYFMPIARDSSNNLICLSTEESTFNQIYFLQDRWGYEQEEIKHQYEAFLIAQTFTDFINSLYSFDLKEIEGVDDVYKLVFQHDKFSLPYSTQVKKYGLKILEFFAQAPRNVEEYFILEDEEPKDSVFIYSVASKGIRFCRRINADGSFEDYQEQLA